VGKFLIEVFRFAIERRNSHLPFADITGRMVRNPNCVDCFGECFLSRQMAADLENLRRAA